MKEKLDYLIEELIEKEQIPGLAVGIVEENEIVYLKGFGAENIETNKPVTENSIFHHASISKTFVATSIMQLVEKGKINLEDTVVEHLPYFKMNDERYKDIKIHQMLSHIAGMPDVEDYEWDKPQYDDEALERFVKSVSGEKLLWNPGEKFRYSNIAYEVLGNLISKVSGITFEDYVKKNILEPLNMKDSSFLKTEICKGMMTTPHIVSAKKGYKREVSEVFPYNRMHGPSSTLYSNVKEMCNYIIAYLNKGEFNGKRIFREENYNKMTTPYAKGFGDDQVGLSWFISEHRGIKTISHSGCDTGFMSNICIMPDKKKGIIVLVNCDYIDPKKITSDIYEVLLGYDIEKMKRLGMFHIGRKVLNEGIEAAKKEYLNIKNCDDFTFYKYDMYYLGIDLKDNGKLEEAIEMVKMESIEYPDDYEYCNLLGELYLLKGDREEGIHHYKKALELNSDNDEAKKALKDLEEN